MDVCSSGQGELRRTLVFETRGAQESGRGQRHHLVDSCDLFNGRDLQRLPLLT